MNNDKKEDYRRCSFERLGRGDGSDDGVGRDSAPAIWKSLLTILISE